MKNLLKKTLVFVLTLAIAMTSFAVIGNTTEVKAADSIKYFIKPNSNADMITLAAGVDSAPIGFNVDADCTMYVSIMAANSDTITASIYNETGALVSQNAVACTYDSSYEAAIGSTQANLTAGNYSIVLNSAAGNYLFLYAGREMAQLNQERAAITVGFSKKLEVSGGKVKSWKSSNTKIATVAKNGKVTAKRVGKCKITAILTTGEKLTCTVNVRKNVYTASKLTAADVSYGNSGANVYNMSYDRKGNLVIRVRYVNKIGYTVKKLESMRIKVTNENGKVIGVYSGAKSMTVASGYTKDFTVTIKKAKLKIKGKQDLANASASLTGKSIYSYR